MTSLAVRGRSRLVDADAPRRPRTALVVIGGYVLCSAILTWLHAGRVAPFVFQDEHVYGMLAQSIGHGDWFSYQDLPVSGYKTLYPVLIAPAWALFSGDTAYHVALTINSVVSALVLFPAYALARRVTAPWPALALAVGATLAPGIAWSGMLMTEALAYPLAGAALLAAVRVLEQPGLRTTAVALLACVAAGTARTQMLVLLPFLFVSVGFDVARHGAAWRERLRAQRFVLATLVALAAIGLLAVLGGRSSAIIGTYSEAGRTAGPGELARYLLRYIGVLAVALGIIPLAGVIALGSRGASWRDRELAPLLCVAVAAIVVFWLNAAWASATLSPELRERYVFYALPAAIATLGALPGRVGVVRLGVISGALAVYLLPAIPSLYGDAGTEFVQYQVRTVTRKLGLGGFGALGTINAWAVACAGMAAITLLALSRASAAARMLALLLIGPTLAFQVVVLGVRELDDNAISAAAAAQYPEPPDFVDRRVRGPAAFVTTPGSRKLARYHYEFWNSSLRRTWRAPATVEYNGLGADCPLEAGPGGGLVPARSLRRSAPDPAKPCSGAALPRYLVFDDEIATVTIANGKLLYAEGPTRLYEIPPGVAPDLTYGAAPRL